MSGIQLNTCLERAWMVYSRQLRHILDMYSAIFQTCRKFRTCACLGSTDKFFQIYFRKTNSYSRTHLGTHPLTAPGSYLRYRKSQMNMRFLEALFSKYPHRFFWKLVYTQYDHPPPPPPIWELVQFFGGLFRFVRKNAPRDGTQNTYPLGGGGRGVGPKGYAGIRCGGGE